MFKYISGNKNTNLTTQKKAAAKANSLSSMLSSFAIEGVKFTPKQIETIKQKSGVNFSK